MNNFYENSCSCERMKKSKRKGDEHHMTYQLKHFDTVLLEFEEEKLSDVPDIKLLWVNEVCKHLLPLDIELRLEAIVKWPKN